jgi:hypothetical protein
VAADPHSRSSRIDLARRLRAFFWRAERPGRRRLAILVVGLTLLVLWQGLFALRPADIDGTFRLRGVTGLADEARFVYFFYYLGLYPVATDEDTLEFSAAGARRILRERGNTLVTEWRHTIRTGDLGKVFLYLPDAILKGAPRDLRLRPAHVALFVIALSAVFVAFWASGHVVLGTAIVVFFGSNPFQLYEVYRNEKVFGWPISVTLLVLAIHVRLIVDQGRPTAYRWIAPLLTGALLGTVREVRSEPVAVIAAVVMTYVALARTPWKQRLALVFLLFVAFSIVSVTWRVYWDFKLEEARRTVTEAGGHPYLGPRNLHHQLWHQVWCGLGDFDTKYGYRWDDRVAVAYARPILISKYRVALPDWDPKSYVYETAFWDTAKKYYKLPYEMPFYYTVLRDKVLHDIVHDPLWYAGILARRVLRIITDTTPVRVAVGSWWLTLPIGGFLIVPLLALLIIARAWMLLKLVGFMVPLSFPALLVYSDQGMTYYSSYHLMTAAIVVGALSAFRRSESSPR